MTQLVPVSPKTLRSDDPPLTRGGPGLLFFAVSTLNSYPMRSQA